MVKFIQKLGGFKRQLSWDFISADFIPPFNLLTPKALAFTMAEILISLTIIGIIAAITLPSLRANINEKTWATQRKALYSRMSQAIAMLPSLNGYGIVMNANGTVNYSETNSNAAMAFVTEGLNKVLKINNICDSTNLSKCGIPNKITVMGTKSKIDFPTKLTELNSLFSYPANPQKDIDTVAIAFETKNSESIAIFYNPYCQPDMHESRGYYVQTKMCANFLYDLNGIKGPNKVGKDISFITVLYSTDSEVVAPMPLEKDIRNNGLTGSYGSNTIDAGKACRKSDSNTRLPNTSELAAMICNINLLGMKTEKYWSGTLVSGSGKRWLIRCNSGSMVPPAESSLAGMRCVKR